MNDILKYLGVVVIGRNEGSRLGDCFDSFPELWSRTIYVDSGSTDASVQIARSRGIKTIELVQGPFTAARGRQVGFAELCTAFPEIRYVQFVDGDCVLQPGWLERGVKYLEHNVRVAVVVGRLQERYADQSLLIRLVNIDWDLPIGDIDAIGGISMVRISSLQKVGGWRTDLIAGEELDLGARLRAGGWNLVRLPAEMVLHDMGIKSVKELWRRSVRSGFSYSELAWLHGRQRCRRWMRRAASNFFYGGVLPLLLILSGVFWYPGMMGVLLLYLILIGRIALWRVRRGDSVGLAGCYGLMLTFCKFAAAVGTFKYLYMRLAGKERRLIEYKTVVTGEGQ